jgi:TFIIF-interacting CTD phosphatase-like protein
MGSYPASIPSECQGISPEDQCTDIQNLSLLGRDLKKCLIIDNNPQCYQWHPDHAVPISSWFEDHLDVELLTMIPLLKDLASDDIDDVRDVLTQSFQHT